MLGEKGHTVRDKWNGKEGDKALKKVRMGRRKGIGGEDAASEE